MYYNIKIITKDSELALETSDRPIIEREMDVYFARIFGASEEFTAGLKTVKINRPEIRSISDIDMIARQVSKKEDDVKQNQSSYNAFEPIVNQFTSNEAKKEEQATVSDIQQNKIDDIFSISKDRTQNVIKEKKPIVEFEDLLFQSDKNDSVENKTEDKTLDSNIELEKEAQKLYEQLQSQVRAQSSSDNSVLESTPGSSFDVELSTQNKHQDALNIFTESPKINSKQNLSDTALNNDTPKKQDDFACVEQEDLDIKGEDVLVDVALPDIFIDKKISTNDEALSESKQNPENMQTKSSNVTFSSFLSGFNVSNIQDEFLICAAYMKNITEERDFTMKQINSKLFQATGKIADTSIVDELIKKEYIKSEIGDDCTKYAITQKGESYLISRLPS